MDELLTETPKSRNPPEQRVKDVPAAKVLAEYSKGQTYNTGLDLYEQVKKNERFYLGDQWSGLKVKSFTPVTLNFLRRVLAYFQSMIVLDLYEQVKKNERFYLGDQWSGLKVKSFTPVTLNFLRRVLAYFQSMIVSDDIAVQILPFRKAENREAIGQVYEKSVERVMERTKLKSLLRESLRDTAVDGDSLLYFYFDPDEPSGQEYVQGDIRAELVMNTNVIFGNSYSRHIQDQPYILIVRRRTVREARQEAKMRGIPEWHSRPAVYPDRPTQDGARGAAGSQNARHPGMGFHRERERRQLCWRGQATG